MLGEASVRIPLGNDVNAAWGGGGSRKGGLTNEY